MIRKNLSFPFTGTISPNELYPCALNLIAVISPYPKFEKEILATASLPLTSISHCKSSMWAFTSTIFSTLPISLLHSSLIYIVISYYSKHYNAKNPFLKVLVPAIPNTV